MEVGRKEGREGGGKDGGGKEGERREGRKEGGKDGRMELPPAMKPSAPRLVDAPHK